MRATPPAPYVENSVVKKQSNFEEYHLPVQGL